MCVCVCVCDFFGAIKSAYWRKSSVAGKVYIIYIPSLYPCTYYIHIHFDTLNRTGTRSGQKLDIFSIYLYTWYIYNHTRLTTTTSLLAYLLHIYPLHIYIYIMCTNIGMILLYIYIPKQTWAVCTDSYIRMPDLQYTYVSFLYYMMYIYTIRDFLWLILL